MLSDDDPTSSDAMRELRQMALHTKATELGFEASPEFPRVFGVLMELPLSGGHAATVVAMCDGSASLYTTSTFGVLGGIGHETVRRAAAAFVKGADPFHDQSQPTADFGYPAADRVRFYLLTYDGVRSIEADIAAVGIRTPRFSP